jgi:RNA polymerase subunit RPABC4/transcription elongation factor Spt4
MSGHIFLVAMLWVLISVAISVHAMDRDRSPFFWGILTIFTGIVGVFVYLVVIGTELDDPERSENVVVCPDCSTRHTDAPTYCSECGTSLETTAETNTASILRSGSRAYCSHCKGRIDLDADQCPHCGSVF